MEAHSKPKNCLIAIALYTYIYYHHSLVFTSPLVLFINLIFSNFSYAYAILIN